MKRTLLFLARSLGGALPARHGRGVPRRRRRQGLGAALRRRRLQGRSRPHGARSGTCRLGATRPPARLLRSQALRRDLPRELPACGRERPARGHPRRGRPNQRRLHRLLISAGGTVFAVKAPARGFASIVARAAATASSCASRSPATASRPARSTRSGTRTASSSKGSFSASPTGSSGSRSPIAARSS